MKSRIITGGIAAVVVAGALGVSGALAGHENTVLEAQLDGREEVRTGATDSRIVGDPNGTGSAYVFGVDGDPKTLCYVLQVDRIAPAQAAHIHEAGAGANGPVVVNLGRPTDGDSADCISESEPAFDPNRTGTTVQEILAKPGDYYVNVHNQEFPGGALRGQLAPGT